MRILVLAFVEDLKSSQDGCSDYLLRLSGVLHLSLPLLSERCSVGSCAQRAFHERGNPAGGDITPALGMAQM